jgi:hypothetical protein
MSEIKTMEDVWTDFYLFATTLYENATEGVYSPTVFPEYYWDHPSLELHTWNSEDFDYESVEVEKTDLPEDIHECLSDILELISGNCLVIPLGFKPRHLLHNLLCIFIRMIRVHTPALFDFPFVVEEIDDESPNYVAYLEILKWINTYDEMQSASTSVTFDESWDGEAAWRLTGFVSRMIPHPMFAKATLNEDGDLDIESPDANYPAAHSMLECIRNIHEDICFGTLDLSLADMKIAENEDNFRNFQASEFVSFLYKMRYVIADEELFKKTVTQCEVEVGYLLNSRISNLYDFVTEPHTLVKGLIT